MISRPTRPRYQKSRSEIGRVIGFAGPIACNPALSWLSSLPTCQFYLTDIFPTSYRHPTVYLQSRILTLSLIGAYYGNYSEHAGGKHETARHDPVSCPKSSNTRRPCRVYLRRQRTVFRIA